MAINPASNLAELQAQSSQGYQPGVAPPGYAGGVVPITNVPLTGYERDALQGLGTITHGGLLEQGRSMMQDIYADPTGTVEQFTAPGTQEALGQMSGAIGRGTAAISGSDIMEQFNPYQKYIEEKIGAQGARARARLAAEQGGRGGRGAFGSTAYGTAMGRLDRDLTRELGDLYFRGYETAADRVAQDRARQFTGAGLYGQRAELGQGVFGQALGLGTGLAGSMFDAADRYYGGRSAALQDRLGAGRYLRQSQQAEAQSLEDEIRRRMGMKPERIGAVANTLSTFPLGTTSSYQPPSTSGLGQLGGAAMALGGSGIFDGVNLF